MNSNRHQQPKVAISRAGMPQHPLVYSQVSASLGLLAPQGAGTAMSSISDEYEQAIQLYNAGDIDGYVSSYADDAVMALPRGIFRGRAAIREAWRRQSAAFPDQVLNVGATLEQGDTFADEFTWVATNTGPLVLRDGTEAPPTGRRAEIKGMELVQMRDGKIALHHIYFDYMTVLSQLGLLPRAATA